MARLHCGPQPKTRVFLVDDEPAVRRGLRLLFGVNPELEVCGEAAGEQEAKKGILASRPDLAVVDLRLGADDGLALIQQLRRVCPELRIVVFSMHGQVHYASSAFTAGAHGYVTKQDGTEQLLQAVQKVMQGRRYLSGRIAAKAPALGQRLGIRDK